MLIGHKPLGIKRSCQPLCKSIKMKYKIYWSYAPFGEETCKILKVGIQSLACLILSTICNEQV
jgi:hypothetical protein